MDVGGRLGDRPRRLNQAGQSSLISVLIDETDEVSPARRLPPITEERADLDGRASKPSQWQLDQSTQPRALCGDEISQRGVGGDVEPGIGRHDAETAANPGERSDT